MIVKLIQSHQYSSQGKKLISRGEYHYYFHYFIELVGGQTASYQFSQSALKSKFYLHLFAEHHNLYETHCSAIDSKPQYLELHGHPILTDLVKSSPFQSSLT